MSGEQILVDDSSRQCVLKFLDAYYSGDIQTATACCDENLDTITYAPIDLFPHLGQQRGSIWVAEAIRHQQQRYSDRKYQLKFMAVEGDNVAAIKLMTLTKRNDGRIVHIEAADFFILRAGLIATHRSFFDSFDFVQQLLGRDLTDSFAAGVRDAMRP